jgi:hypothetical protein
MIRDYAITITSDTPLEHQNTGIGRRRGGSGLRGQAHAATRSARGREDRTCSQLPCQALSRHRVSEKTLLTITCRYTGKKNWGADPKAGPTPRMTRWGVLLVSAENAVSHTPAGQGRVTTQPPRTACGSGLQGQGHATGCHQQQPGAEHLLVSRGATGATPTQRQLARNFARRREIGGCDPSRAPCVEQKPKTQRATPLVMAAEPRSGERLHRA